MKDMIYQKIFNEIMEFLPDKWEKLVFYAGYTEGSYSMKFYTKDEYGVYTDSFSLTNSSKTALVKLFLRIDKLISKERNDMVLKDKWTVMTMQVDVDGKMQTFFDYTDISEKTIEYEDKWKRRYLV